MKLRDYQQAALEQCRDSMRKGLKRPVIAAPTAFGKTVLAGQMLKNCQDAGKTGWFLCDRIQLIQQSIDKFTQMGINFGVKQANHPLTNPHAPIQIVSIQTLAAMVGKHGRKMPEFDMAIVDECHTQYDVIKMIIEKFNNIPVIGLSATPYSKGLGLLYNNLIVPITTRELLARDMLAQVRYYGGAHVDLSNVKSINPNTFSAQDLESETDKDSDRLAGHIIDNWVKYGEDSQTIAFSPSKALSRNLVERFTDAGMAAEHIDCDTPLEDRLAMYEAHDRGEFKILSCSRLLNTGYDAPSVRCLIDCFPCKSITTYVQRVGRLMRIHPGKHDAIYLDHASNFERFGYAEDIVPEALHDGKSTHKESDLTENAPMKEAATKECPQCMQQMSGLICKACGYQTPKSEILEDDGEMLVAMTGSSANRKDSREMKEQFYSELKHYGKEKGYKDGWASNQYREKYSVWPNKTKSYPVTAISTLTTGWLKHQHIKRAAEKRNSKV